MNIHIKGYYDIKTTIDVDKQISLSEIESYLIESDIENIEDLRYLIETYINDNIFEIGIADEIQYKNCIKYDLTLKNLDDLVEHYKYLIKNGI